MGFSVTGFFYSPLTFKTYVQTENGYRVTSPEGYVLHHGGDMIKLVNRVEFSFINFTLDKSWK